MTTAIDVLRQELAHKDTYQQILNYFGGDEDTTRKFVSAGVHVCRKNPELLNCDRNSLIEALITCADLQLFPSSASGEAFILPYKVKGRKVAQFQLGYQGLITLGYKAGNREVVAELVRKNDVFSISRGKVHHEVDPTKTKEERGEAIGAYGIIVTRAGGTIEQYMHMKDIVAHAKKFSKSFDSSFTPWDPENDPEGWMPRKTVLKQTYKLAPKNETIARAIELDNRDSIISDREDRRRIDTAALKEAAPTMRKLEKKNTPHEKTSKKVTEAEIKETTEHLFPPVAGNRSEGEGPGD